MASRFRGWTAEAISGRTVAAAPKYGNRKKMLDGHTFDSVAESRRYLELRAMEKAGEITGLVLQPRYELQAGFRDPHTKEWVRSVVYVGDFQYTDTAGRVITEDIKGVETEGFRIKRRLFIARFPDIELRIIPVRRKKGKR